MNAQSNPTALPAAPIGLPSLARFAGCGHSLFAALLALLLFFPGIAAAQAEKRVALVVGNAAYRHTAALANPRHDAEDVAATLRGAGFEVVEGLDLDKAGMDETLVRFARLAADADAALIFYAGHGMQYEGQNYLVPVDAELKDEIGIQFETTSLDDVMNAFVRVTGIRILILDACRNNPLAGRLAQNRVTIRNGLSRISSPRGMLVASATQADELAYDGATRNSVFTSALVAEMRVPGLEIHELFRRVGVAVSEETEGKQLPETASSLAGSFYLKPGETGEDAWLRLRDSADVKDLRGFIERFPSSLLADAAKARIELVERTGREEELQARLAEAETALRRVELAARGEAPAPEPNPAGIDASAAAAALPPVAVAAVLRELPVATELGLRAQAEADATASQPPLVVASRSVSVGDVPLPGAEGAKPAAPPAADDSARLVTVEPAPAPTPAPLPAEPPAFAPGASDEAAPNCAQILERAQLGELTARDQQLLAQHCH